MKNLTCDIIRDLIPSYLDGICSEDSKQLVEEHLAGCENCRDMVRGLENTVLSAGKWEMDQIRFAKAFRRQARKENLLGMLSLLLLAASGLAALCFERYGALSSIWCGALLFLCQTGVGFFARTQGFAPQKTDRTGWILSAAAGVGFVFIAAVLFFIWPIQNAAMEWGFDPYGIGRLIHGVLGGLLAAETAVFALSLVRMCRKEVYQPLPVFLSLTGGWLAVDYRALLHTLSTVEEFGRKRLLGLILLLAAGALGTLFSLFLTKRER